MQISQQFTATQKVSLESYQRLRETLIQQACLFESVITEAQFLPLFSQPSADQPVSELVAQRFVLMRSPDFSVLLIATPLASPLSSTDLTHAVADQTHARSIPSSRLAKDHNFSPRHSPKDLPERSSEQPPDSSHGLLLSTQQTRQTSDLIHAAVAQAIESTLALPTYQIRLSFDRQTIDDFACQLTPRTSDHKADRRHISSKQSLRHPGPPSHIQPVPTRTPNAMKRQIKRQSNRPPTARRHEAKVQKTPKNEEFILAWTKQLAESPDGSTQSTLANQVQQSLLLNQVITRIRHSLDLSAILETTVAQVREFLSADRLVVYQFEQLEAVDYTSPSSTEPFAVEGVSAPERDASQATYSTDQDSGAVIGRCTHTGHITYESRVSEDLPSVLNLSEANCFEPTLSIRRRYLRGKPVAVDDVERHYAHTPCLLDFLHQAQVKSKIIAPIIVQGQLWGLLIAHQCDRTRHWLDTEVLFLQHIAEHLTVAISQAGLYKQLQDQTLSLESCVVERTQNLHDALLAAESANHAKGEFLSTMSHELRTPLTYIIGMSATLLRWSFGELSDRQRSYLDTINHSGEQLLGIINDILEFAKMSSGRSCLDISEFSLRALIETVFDQFQAIADKQEVQLSLVLEVTAQEDSFRADAKRLQQILANLIHNAIKFTPAGGQVTLRVRCEDQVGIFQVEDTGIGIPEAQQGLLFEKFKQLESPFQRQYSGTGLGLAMTKRLVDLHGGTIQIKSKVGKGSIFSVRLPAQLSQNVSTRYQVPTTLAAGSKRILLLESRENSAAIICDLLTADGYEVIWHPEAETILTQIESLQPAMLIADLSILSHNPSNLKDIQLAITSMGAKVLALLDKSDSESSHMAHHDTLSKPIDPKQLLEKVRYLTLNRA